MMKNTKAIKPLTGHHMVMIFGLFFGVVFAVNIFMTVSAVRSWTGLVVENSYVASQQFNAETALLNKSAAMGILHQLHYKNGTLSLSLKAKDGHATDAKNVQVIIGTPNNGESQTLDLLPSASGEFIANAKLVVGIWSGELSAVMNGTEKWKQPIRLIVENK